MSMFPSNVTVTRISSGVPYVLAAATGVLTMYTLSTAGAVWALSGVGGVVPTAASRPRAASAVLASQPSL